MPYAACLPASVPPASVFALGSLARAAAALIGVAVLAAAGGCDQPAPTPIPPPDRPATGPATEPSPPVIDSAALKPDDPTPAAPHYLVGRVLGADGKPVALDGVRMEVQVNGFLADSLASITETVEVNRDGTYVKKLRKGTYRQPTARIEFPFRRATYRLPLVPVRGVSGQQESADGIVQDFVWRLTGPRPGVRAEKNRPDTWLGGSAVLEYHSLRPDVGRVVRPAPAGTKVVITLTPTGPLADGSAGKPIQVTRTYNPTDTALNDALVVDLPLAHYQIAAEEQFPDGRRQPMLLGQRNGAWADQTAGTFAPDLPRSGLGQVAIVLTRRER